MNYCVVDEKDRLIYSCPYEVSVGDTVELPPLPWMSENWRARVVALGRGSYQGPCKSVIRIIPPEELKRDEELQRQYAAQQADDYRRQYWIDELGKADRRVHSYECPRCHAAPGKPCVLRSGGLGCHNNRTSGRPRWEIEAENRRLAAEREAKQAQREALDQLGERLSAFPDPGDLIEVKHRSYWPHDEPPEVEMLTVARVVNRDLEVVEVEEDNSDPIWRETEYHYRRRSRFLRRWPTLVMLSSERGENYLSWVLNQDVTWSRVCGQMTSQKLPCVLGVDCRYHHAKKSMS